jgi:signal transduction histidine kinase
MKKASRIILLVIFLFLLNFPQKSFSAGKVKTVVVFFSLNEAVPAYQNILEGLHASLPVYFGEPYNLLIEYLDFGRTRDNDYLKHIITLYNEKFTGNEFDLIITVGPGTYPLLKKNGLTALNQTPIIEIDLDNFNAGNQIDTGKENVFEIIIKLNFVKTLKSVFDLFPDTGTAYIISGSSPVDQYYNNLTRQATKAFEGKYDFIYVSGISLDSTLQIVKKIPSNSIVVIPSYMTDVNNAPISTTFALNNISNQCIAPLFTMSDNFIKKGGIGGLVFSFSNVGKEAGRVAGEILKGKNMKEIILNEDGFYQDIYDWKQLKKWNLLKSKAIPSSSTFINKEFNFVYEYRWFILGILLFLIAQTALIIYFISLYKRQKDMARQKSEIEQLFRELVREDRLSKMAELTASLSHELSQPLTAILYNAQAGMRFLNSDKLDTRQAKEIFLNIIEDDKRASGLISSIRSLMKLESREKEVVNLNSLIKETINIFNFEAIKHNIKIILNLEKDPVYVFGDKIQLQQVIMNFLSNAEIALDNMDADKRLIEINQKLSDGLVSVSVKDTGPGISNAILEKIFNPFVTTRKNGFGIGLAISNTIIERHDGKIWAENIDGGGAKFSFSLPIVNK